MSESYDYDFIFVTLYFDARGIGMNIVENMIAELHRRLSMYPRSVLNGDHYHHEYWRYGCPAQEAGTYSCGFTVSVDALCVEADAADHLTLILAVCQEHNLTIESLTLIKPAAQTVEFTKENLEAIRAMGVWGCGAPTTD